MVKCLQAVLLILALAILDGCVDQKYKNEGCVEVQGLEVSLYSRSRCQNGNTYPPEIDNILLCIFDGEGILARHLYLTDLELSTDYSVTVQTDPGLYTVIGWAGVDSEQFDAVSPVDGETDKNDLLFAIVRSGETAADIEETRVYFGESKAVYVDAGESEGSETENAYKTVSVNLLEVTNRIIVSVEGLPTEAEDYDISIEAENGSMNYDGTIADDEILTYPAILSYGDGSVEGSFTLLKLETGFHYSIIVRNDVSGTELYRGSLLGALILKNPEVDLNCDHDFTIRFTAEDQCDCGTYTIAEIYVNNWLVHSYEIDW